MDWFKGSVIFVVLLFVGIYSFLYVAVSVGNSVEDKLTPANIFYGDNGREYYGFDGRIHNPQGELIAIYEPIMNRIRPATLSDKLFYGELN